MAIRQSKSLVDLLLEYGVLDPKSLEHLKSEASRLNMPIKRALTHLDILSEDNLYNLLSNHLGIPTVDLNAFAVNPEVILLVPEALARQHVIIPIFKIGDVLTIATEDPLDVFAIDAVRLKSGCEIKVALAGQSAILRAISQHYGIRETTEEVAQAIADADVVDDTLEETHSIEVGSDNAESDESPIVRLVNLLISHAYKERASDIHIEPGDKHLRTRFRVDGVLREVEGPPVSLHLPVVSRIKVLSQMDISERRKPQDGRFRVRVDQHNIDIRVSTVPTQFGEKVVMRLLDQANALFPLKDLGMEKRVQESFETILHAPHGILLVTGPTGSGKSTSLYTGLSAINSQDLNIMTIEDPVEYHLPGINQIQVNPLAEVTFASALRAFLRQDPDVIMVGEIRDPETAEIAMQASLTGHLVLSTLHTNDSAGAIPRLIEIGLEPFLISSAMLGILAQRLVRVICVKCREEYDPPEKVLLELGLNVGTKLFRGAGCMQCQQSGYRGRMGIYELLVMNDRLRKLIIDQASSSQIKAEARQLGMMTLREDAVRKLKEGFTTVEEIFRVTHADEVKANDSAV